MRHRRHPRRYPSEGVHLAAIAGTFDILQRCFAGVGTRGDALWLNPYWPPRLGTVEFDLRDREHQLTVRITGEAPGCPRAPACDVRSETTGKELAVKAKVGDRRGAWHPACND